MNRNHNDNTNVFEMLLDSQAGAQFIQAAPSGQSVQADWHEHHQEGQLAVDVLEGERDIIVISPMAGAESQGVEVYIHNDLLTIRGMRPRPVEMSADHTTLHQECFWGRFSRTVVLPVDVKADLASATYKNGILVLHIPKRQARAQIPITVVEE